MDKGEKYDISTYLAPLDSVVRSTPEESLGTVLSLVDRGHTPIFVFDHKDHFKGLISPYKTIYKHRHPYTTKVGTLVFTPPHITKKTPLYDVVDFMLTTRIYTLPVFDTKEKVIGVIRAKDILQGMKDDQDFLTYVSKTVVPRDPITAPITAKVEDVYQVMRSRTISRILLVNDEGALEGIIARSDLMNAFINPTPKQRFSKKSGDSGYFAFDEEKEYRRDDPVRKYYTPLVETIPVTSSLKDTVVKLIETKHNSLVQVDRNMRPLGFLSVRDLLESMSTLRPEEDLRLSVNKPSDAVSDEDFEEAMKHLSSFSKKMQKRLKIDKIDVTFEEPKYPDEETAIYNTSVIVTPRLGEKIVAKTHRKIFLDSLRAATELIEKQEQRKADMKGHHYAATL